MTDTKILTREGFRAGTSAIWLEGAPEYIEGLEATVEALARFARALDAWAWYADESTGSEYDNTLRAEHDAARKVLTDAGWLE